VERGENEHISWVHFLASKRGHRINGKKQQAKWMDDSYFNCLKREWVAFRRKNPEKFSMHNIETITLVEQ